MRLATGSDNIEALLLDAPMNVERCVGAQCTQLSFADGSRARIAADGLQIDVLQAGDAFTAVLWGPLLLLALARRGIFCLHASAFAARDGKVAVVVADSGVGKSTLAAAAAQAGGRALVDDLCLLHLDAEGQPWLLPRFPQLKWPVAAHWPADQPAAIAITRLGLLQRGVASTARAASTAELLRILLAHTVAARLFEPELLQRHLRLCVSLATSLAQRGAGFRWSVQDSPQDPGGAMLGLLQRIEWSP